MRIGKFITHFIVLSVALIFEGNATTVQRKDVEWLDKCGVVGFSLFVPSIKATTPIGEEDYFYPLAAKVMLDTYPKQRINFIAHTGKPCKSTEPIRCVKLKFGDSWIQKERIAPYALYPNASSGRRPRETGFQNLEAWTYGDMDCTKGESGYLMIHLQLVPKSIDTINGGPLTAIFIGSKSSIVSTAELQTVANVTCNYLSESFSYGFIYRQSLSVTDFKCKATLVSGSSAQLKLMYSVTATFEISKYWSPYGNSDMPSTSTVTNYMSMLLRGNETQGPGEDKYIIDYMKGLLPSTNPFYSTTEIRTM